MNDVIMKKIMLLFVGVTARLAVVAALLLTAGYPLHVGLKPKTVNAHLSLRKTMIARAMLRV